MRQHGTISEGVVAGIIGATAVALWFLVVDVIAGHPLYTPETLGAAALSFFGPAGSEGSMIHIAFYTVVHYAAFIVIGVILMSLIHAANRVPAVLVAVLILFVAFELGFHGFTEFLAQSPSFRPIAWYQIFAANLVAAVCMGWYVHRTHPNAVRQLDLVLRGGE